MLLWKIWFDLRLRFYCSLALLLLLLAVVIAIYPMLSSAKPPTDSYSQQTLQPLLKDYSLWINRYWFVSNARTCFYIMAIALALGGIPAEKRRGAILMTLALPVKRWLWVAANRFMREEW